MHGGSKGFVGNFTERMADASRRNGWTAWFCLFALLCTSLWVYAPRGEYDKAAGGLALGFLYACWSIGLVSLPQSPRAKRILAVLMAVWVGVMCLFQLFLLRNYNLLINEEVIGIMLASNRLEAVGMLGNALVWRSMLLPATLFLVLLALSLFLWRRVRIRIGAGVKLGVALLILVLTIGATVKHIRDFRKMRGELHVPKMRYYMMSPMAATFWGFLDALVDAERLAMQCRQAGAVAPVVQVDGETEPFLLVVVLGESERKEYMHCYGYPVQNTPRIDSLVRAGRIVLFANAVAPNSNTNASVPESFTLHNIDSGSVECFETPSLMRVLRKAGWSTVWLSNQAQTGFFNDKVSGLAATSDTSIYMGEARPYQRSGLDGELLPFLQQRSDSTDRLFEVVHLMGQHEGYETRYPADSVWYCPDSVLYKPANLRAKVAQYLNAIRYGDWVLGEILNAYEKDDALVFYFSDHAQALGDDASNPHVTAHSFSRPGLRIPYMVYGSPSFQRKHPQLWEAIFAARLRLFRNDLFAQSLCQLLGIRVEGYCNPEENMFSPAHDTARGFSVGEFQYQGLDTVDSPLSYRLWLQRQLGL